MDRLSNLPDELLHQILSFLPTKDAAVTSVLSKKWVNLWKLNPNLDIDDSVFLHPEDGKGQSVQIRQSFVDFVDSVLAMHGDSPIKNFSLKCITGVHPDIVNRWICNVVNRGVSHLDLFTDFSNEDTEDDIYLLPRELFFSSSLVKLKLRSERSVDWWCRGSLPMLRSLNVDSELILCSQIDKFIASFPVLEELRMATLEWDKMDLTVSSASLRKLNLHATGFDGSVNPRSVSFDTPNLISLNYFDLVAEDYPLVNMKKLDEASINLIVKDVQVKRLREPNNDLLEDGDDDGDDDEDNDGDVVLQFGNVVKLMKGIQNVHHLSLNADTIEVLALCCESMPMFKNVKFLGVTGEEGRGWQAMPVLIRNCPHLETIIVRGLLHDVTDKCGDACPCISREEKGLSLKSCPVNRLEIQGFRGTMKEMTMIKHFLDYFPSVKRFDVFVEDNEPTQLRNPELSDCVVELFELYNKSSPSCNLQLLVSDFLDKKWTEQGHI